MNDPVLTRKKSTWDILFSNANLTANYFKKIAKLNLKTEKKFKFKKYRQKSIFWIEVPIVLGMIPKLIHEATTVLAKSHKLDFHVKIKTKDDVKLWMNEFPDPDEHNNEINTIHCLSIGFSKRKKKPQKH